MRDLLKKIDNLITQIKNKIEIGGQGAADIFILLTLEITRAEIINGNISDLTIGALKEISATTSHFYYYRDYRDLYNQLNDVYIEISKLDGKFHNADFESSVNYNVATWAEYISKSSFNLINNSSSSYKIS